MSYSARLVPQLFVRYAPFLELVEEQLVAACQLHPEKGIDNLANVERIDFSERFVRASCGDVVAVAEMGRVAWARVFHSLSRPPTRSRVVVADSPVRHTF